MNLKQKKIWIKQVFENGAGNVELRGDECRNVPQASQVANVMNDLIGNRINVVEYNLNGEVERDEMFKIGQWHWDIYEVDEVLDIFTDDVSIVLGVEISENGEWDSWMTNVQFRNGEVYDVTTMNMMDDTELTLYHNKPVKVFEIRPEKNGRSITNHYSYKF